MLAASFGVVVTSTEKDNIFNLYKTDTYTDYITAGAGVQVSIGNISSEGEKIGDTYSFGFGVGAPPLAGGGGYSNSDIFWSKKMFEDFTEEDAIYGIMNILDPQAAFYYDCLYDNQVDHGYNYDYYSDPYYWDYLYYGY